MNTDANAAHAAANLAGVRDATYAVDGPAETDAGYRAAVATGGIEVDGDVDVDEDTPLLNRSDTFRSRRESPDRSNANAGNDRQHSPPTWHGETDYAGLPWHKRPSVAWLLFPFLLYALVFGGTIVPGVEVITQLLCREHLIEQMGSNSTSLVSSSPFLQEEPYLDPKYCNKNPQVQASVALFSLWGQVIGGVLSAVTSPKIGSLSDRYGRRKFLALTAVGTLAKDLIYILIFKFPTTLNVRWLLCAFAVDGLCGSFTAGMAVTNAYASDCTPPKKRAVTFGWFHGCLFAGIALGPIAAGYVVKFTGDIINMFYLALGTHMVFILFVLLVVPESLTKARQKEARAKKMVANLDWVGVDGITSFTINGIWRSIGGRSFFEPLKILWPTGPGTSARLRRNMVILAWVDTTMFGVAMGAMTVVIIYTKAAFDWDIVQSSIFITTINVARVSVLLLLMPLIFHFFRSKSSPGKELKQAGCDDVDKWTIVVAVAFDMMGFIGYAVAPTGALMILSGVIASVGGMASPTTQGSLTKHVPPHQVGQLLGATGLLHALARVAAPAACNFIYARTVVRGAPQVVFVVLAAVFAIALSLSFFIKKGVYLDAQAVEEEYQRLQREGNLIAQERAEEEEFS